MTDDDALTNDLMAAMRDTSPLEGVVEMTTEDGMELLLYGPGPAYSDAGTMFLPAAALTERN